MEESTKPNENKPVQKKSSSLLEKLKTSLRFIDIGLLGFRVNLHYLIYEITTSKDSINRKIDEAYNALKSTSSLIEDLQSDLEEKALKIDELKEKYEEYSKLAEIEEDKVKPLTDSFEKMLRKSSKKERKYAIVINLVVGLIIFIIGIWQGPNIKSLLGIKDNVNKVEVLDENK